MNDDQRKQYLIEFGNRVKELRLEKEMSQDELAKRCGYGSRSTINKIELGINDIPQSKIKAIAEALNVSIGTLLCWDEMDSSHDTKKLQAEVEQIELDSTIEKKYGKSAFEALTMFVQLDTLDQGRIIGSMETLLEDEKYSVKKESSNGKAM
jgi:transcriptional regulator with XRE-family HTH domain